MDMLHFPSIRVMFIWSPVESIQGECGAISISLDNATVPIPQFHIRNVTPPWNVTWRSSMPLLSTSHPRAHPSALLRSFGSSQACGEELGIHQSKLSPYRLSYMVIDTSRDDVGMAAHLPFRGARYWTNCISIHSFRAGKEEIDQSNEISFFTFIHTGIKYLFR